MKTKYNDQPFCNTTDVYAKICELGEHNSKDWRNFNGDSQTFIGLQKAIKPELDFLTLIYEDAGKSDTYPTKSLCKWRNALRAFDDMPLHLQDMTTGRGYFDHYDKWDVLFRRKDWLEEIYSAVFCLFHDWQFCKQGWTAY